MNRSILELLGILFLIFVIMSEPPEKKFKTEAVAKAHQIIRNSVVVPVPSIVAIQTVPPVVQVIPVVSVPSVVTNVAGGEYQTGAGQSWPPLLRDHKKINLAVAPTRNSTMNAYIRI